MGMRPVRAVVAPTLDIILLVTDRCLEIQRGSRDQAGMAARSSLSNRAASSNSRCLEDSRGIRGLGGWEKNVFVNFWAEIQHNGYDISSDG